MSPEFVSFHQASTVGAFVLGIGILVAFAVLVHSMRKGKPVGGNPWGAASLELQPSSPPSFHNFDHKIVLNDPYDFDSQIYDAELDTYVQREFIEPAEKPEPEKQPQHS